MKYPRGWDKCFVSSKEFITLQEAVEFTKSLADSYYRSDYIKPNWLYAFAEGTDNSYAYVVVLGEEVATVLDFCPDSWGVSIAYSSITQMMLRKAFGQKVDFSGANLAGVDLSRFYLRSAKLSGSNLSAANLSKTKLEGADLRGANLSHANLWEALTSGTDFTDAIFCQTIMPDGIIRNS
ncbi:MAG: pentapeptide repeat-containing protein [Nostocaceae cyanobacterium]|nr:pentapeptide repeat-containing protein [Nostocaceae cyanobacterium]